MARPAGDETVDAVMAMLALHQSDAVLANKGPKFGIHTNMAIGVSMADMKAVARQLGKNHKLAKSLWLTGNYEARTIAALIDDPAMVTATQMRHWCRDFDNWAICDTVCFNLFDKAPDAWTMVDAWAGSKSEFGKRAAFALLWSLALHDKSASDHRFIHGLALIEREASDDRNFVTKAVAMALRAVSRRNDNLAKESLLLAHRLQSSTDRTAQRIGRTAAREMTRAK